jgi:BlaI family transcriptional regulator, penicillinase repressor
MIRSLSYSGCGANVERPTTQMPIPRPTDAELTILRVLWERGPSTVRQVHDVLLRERPTAYTTALKLLQIMTEKGLVRRDERDRTHVYHPRLSEQQTQQQLIRDLLDRAFGGSSSKLVMQALATERASAEELREIRKLLDGRKGSARREEDDERD